MTPKDLKIKQVEIVLDELRAGIIAAIEAGADRSEDKELPVFFMIARGVDLLEMKIQEIVNAKHNRKLDN